MFPKEGNPRLERVRFELRSTGIKPEQFQRIRSGIHTRGYLPHVKREGARYFATFRLSDSLPQAVLLKIQSERAQALTALQAQALQANPSGTPLKAAMDEIERDYHRKVERYLDKGCGACYLRLPAIAAQVAGALRFFEGQRYVLKDWVIMPNHVHAVLWPMPNYTLSSILKGWKGFSAREANKTLGRTGERFWQPESFDHWIRNDQEHAAFCRYVVNNPVKAGLCREPQDWQWSSAWNGKSSADF
jgi:REP element-mobilizing transposase RayT